MSHTYRLNSHIYMILGLTLVSALIGISLARDIYIVLGVGPALLLLSFALPNYSILLLCAAAVWSLFWLPGVSLDVYNPAKEALVILYLIIAIASAFLIRRRPIYSLVDSKAARLLLLYTLALSLGLRVASTLPSELAIFIRHIAAFLIYFSVRDMLSLNPGRIEKIWKILFLPVALSCFYIVLAASGLIPELGVPTSFLDTDPLRMGFSYTNVAMSWSIAFVISVPAVLLWRTLSKPDKGKGERWQAIGWAALLVLLLYANLLTLGRGGLFGVLTSILVAVHFLIVRRLVKITLGILSFAATGIAIALNPTFVEVHLLRSLYTPAQILNQGFSWDILEILTSSRINLWFFGLRQIVAAPLTGVGLGHAADSTAGSALRSAVGASDTHIHNLYLNSAVEGGVLAGITALALMVYVAIHYYRVVASLNDRRQHPFAIIAYATISAYIVSTLIEVGQMFSSQYTGLPFWIALATLDVIGKQGDFPLTEHQKRNVT